MSTSGWDLITFAMPSITSAWPGGPSPKLYFRSSYRTEIRLLKGWVILMILMPEIKKAQRDLMGLFTITFTDKDDGKEFTKAFSELRGGICWPIRAFPGYLCILGLFAGAVFGKEDSLMLVYEKEYENAVELMTDAYNRAADLRCQKFYTNGQSPEWRGYNYEFNKKIRSNLGARDTRLLDSPLAQDFAYGKDVIKRLAGEKAFLIPSGSILIRQLRDITPEDMQAERAGEKFYAINGFRFPVVAWDFQVNSTARRQGSGNGEGRGSVLGWS